MINISVKLKWKERKRIAIWYFFLENYTFFLLVFGFTLLPISMNRFSLTSFPQLTGTVQSSKSELSIGA